MKINDTLSGFVLKRQSAVEEINATVYSFEHEESGATLYYIDRDDECKTFGIGFKTIPTDDTGAFHIIEHSVLCGSEKYPIKDPFTEMMKGSVNVYMNAFTAPDKTYYPISTRNEQDFYNLISVYLDAVLNPLMLKNKSIFLREGIRTELDEQGHPVYSGVVYNEMTGAYSRVEEEANYLLSRLLFPGGSYSFDTGGHPDAIPELTYEKLCEVYREFYHPSNSCIILDGMLNIDKTLELIDSFLRLYEKKECDHPIILGEAPDTKLRVAGYAIEEGQKKTDAGYLFLSHRLLEYEGVEDTTALAALADSLADTNDAPLKREVMSLALCDNFHITVNADLKYVSVDVEFTGVKEGKEAELVEKYRKICRKIIEGGIDRRIIEATLNAMEFRARESDLGANPKGMLYLCTCLDAWCYGEAPERLLSYNKLFNTLKERLRGDYYDSLARKLLLPDEYCSLLMLPDEKLHGEIAKRRSEDCERRLCESGKEAVLGDTESFYRWQDEDDSPEALATVPRLSLDDLREEPKETPIIITETDGVKVIAHPIHTSDIIYAEAYFDVSDLAEEEIHELRLLTAVIPDLATEKGSAGDFATRKKEEIGSLYVSVEPVKRLGEPKLYFCVKASALKSKEKELIELIHESLYGRILSDATTIKKKLAQLSETSEAQLASHGTTFAIMRNAARYDRFEALKEICFGFSSRKYLKNTLCDFDKNEEKIIKSFKRLISMLGKERLTLGVTCPEWQSFAEGLIKRIPVCPAKAGRCPVGTLPRLSEGIVAPTHSGFSVRGSNIYASGGKYHGALGVVSNILSLDILMDEIRLKGGAYDTGFIARANSGTLAAYSYRDPTPENSVEVFSRLGEGLREFLDTDPDLDSYIISTVGGLDPLSTPRSEGSASTLLYLSGLTHADTVRLRKEALEATKEELYSLSEDIEKAFLDSTVTVVASKEKLREMGDVLDKILEL